jgi:hypothetical protein
MKQFSGHYIRDVVFIASLIWIVGIIFFSIATIAYIQGVADLTHIPAYYYLALLPTFLGGFFFLIGAVMQMTLTQRKWYVPSPNRLGWWAGFWNAVRSIAFAIRGCLCHAIRLRNSLLLLL